MINQCEHGRKEGRDAAGGVGGGNVRTLTVQNTKVSLLILITKQQHKISLLILITNKKNTK